VLAVAEAFDRVDETFLYGGDFQEVQAWLRSIDGIGEWSAAFVLFRGLGRIERMPLTPPFVKAVRAVYGASLTEPEIARIAKGYGPWAGYWAMYLRAGTGEIE
jgi:DNA-3-methyladenine glycosylase II